MQNEIKKDMLEEDLNLAQTMRRKILEELTGSTDVAAKEFCVPQDPTVLGMTMQLLKDMDNNAIRRKQIGVQEGSNEIARETKGFLASITRQLTQSPLRVDTPVKRDVRPDIVIERKGDITEPMLSQEPEAGKTTLDEFTEEFLDANPEYR